MWHNPSQQYIICAPEGTQKPWTGRPGECLHRICDLFPLVQMSCGSLTPFSTYLHVTHKTRTRKHPQKSVFNWGDLPPFAEDGIGDNFSSRLQFRWSSSYTRHVFPSFSSCFLTQKSKASLSGSMLRCCWESCMLRGEVVRGCGFFLKTLLFFLPTTPQHSYSFLFRCFPVSFFSSSSNRAKVFWKKLVRDGWWQPHCPSFLCPHLPLRLALLSLHTALMLHQPASSIHYCVLTGIAFFL